MDQEPKTQEELLQEISTKLEHINQNLLGISFKLFIIVLFGFIFFLKHC